MPRSESPAGSALSLTLVPLPLPGNGQKRRRTSPAQLTEAPTRPSPCPAELPDAESAAHRQSLHPRLPGQESLPPPRPSRDPLRPKGPGIQCQMSPGKSPETHSPERALRLSSLRAPGLILRGKDPREFPLLSHGPELQGICEARSPVRGNARLLCASERDAQPVPLLPDRGSLRLRE